MVHLSRQQLSALSRPHSVINQAPEQQNSKALEPQVDPAPGTHRMNWCHPLIWSVIDQTARAVGPPYSAVTIVRHLQLIDSLTFASLRPQRISQWRDLNFPHSLKWTDAHL